MATQKNNFKITPDVRKQIAYLCEKLPQIPYIIKDAKGNIMVPKVTVTKFTGTSDHKYVADTDKLETYRVNYQKGQTQRMRNHKVDLNDFYQKFGQEGIDKYVRYVYDVDARLKKPSALDKIKKVIAK